MKTVFLFILVTLYAPLALAQNEICNVQMHQQLIQVARSPVTDEEVMGTLAQLFTKYSPIFYSSGFRTTVLKALEIEFRVSNEDLDGAKLIRQKLRNFEVDPARYKNQIESISNRVLDTLTQDLTAGEPSDIRVIYGIRKTKYDQVKNNVVTIQNNSRLRPLMVRLIQEVFGNSLDLYIRFSHMHYARGYLRAGGDGPGTGFSAFWTGPFVVLWESFYRWGWHVGRYELTKRSVVSGAVSKATGGHKGIELDKFSAPAALGQEGEQQLLEYSEIAERFRSVPLRSLLDRYDTLLRYADGFLDTVQEFNLKRVETHNRFLQPGTWQSLYYSFDSVVSSKQMTPTDRSAFQMSLTSMSNFVDNYRLALAEQQMVLAVAEESLATMRDDAADRLAQFGASQSPQQALEKRELDKIAQRLSDLQTDLARVNATLGSWSTRLDEVSEWVRSLEKELDPLMEQQLTPKDLKERLKAIASILQIEGFSW